MNKYNVNVNVNVNVNKYIHVYIYIYIYRIFENMADEKYIDFTKTWPNKDFYDPDQPENHRKERGEGKGERTREKNTRNSL